MYLCYDMFYILWFSPKKDLWNVNKLNSTQLDVYTRLIFHIIMCIYLFGIFYINYVSSCDSDYSLLQYVLATDYNDILAQRYFGL
jgi:hypothetical protein